MNIPLCRLARSRRAIAPTRWGMRDQSSQFMTWPRRLRGQIAIFVCRRPKKNLFGSLALFQSVYLCSAADDLSEHVLRDGVRRRRPLNETPGQSFGIDRDDQDDRVYSNQFSLCAHGCQQSHGMKLLVRSSLSL